MKTLLISAILFAGLLAGCSQPAAEGGSTGDTATTGTTGTTASKSKCAECGKEFASTELIAHGTAMICKSCDAAHGH